MCWEIKFSTRVDIPEYSNLSLSSKHFLKSHRDQMSTPFSLVFWEGTVSSPSPRETLPRTKTHHSRASIVSLSRSGPSFGSWFLTPRSQLRRWRVSGTYTLDLRGPVTNVEPTFSLGTPLESVLSTGPGGGRKTILTRPIVLKNSDEVHYKVRLCQLFGAEIPESKRGPLSSHCCTWGILVSGWSFYVLSGILLNVVKFTQFPLMSSQRLGKV